MGFIGMRFSFSGRMASPENLGHATGGAGHLSTTAAVPGWQPRAGGDKVHTSMALPPLVTTPRHWLLGPGYYAQREPLRWIPKWIEEHGAIFRVVSPFGQATVVAAPDLARQVLADRY